MTKLGLTGFRNAGPLEDRALTPQRVRLPLRQHSGAPSQPVVRAGERVHDGDVVAVPAPGTLGARIHASIPGVVRNVEGEIEIEA
jgi:Na+-translocating ferredoxin:NAD+ oxidoreductase RnfC subunit